jgi:cobalt-zinc-cadmium resistance protein CzcA
VEGDPRLKKAQSVVDVTNFGGLTTQFMLELDPARLLQYGLALSQVIEAINANNASGGGSVIDRGDVSYVVRGVGLLGSLDDMGNVVVKTTDSGTPVLVKDLGQLTYGNVERRGILGKDGNSDTLRHRAVARAPTLAGAGGHPCRRGGARRQAAAARREGRALPGPHHADRAHHAYRGQDAGRRHDRRDPGAAAVPGQPARGAVTWLTIPMALLLAFIFMHHARSRPTCCRWAPSTSASWSTAPWCVVGDILRRREAGQTGRSRPDAISATLQVARPIFFGMCVIIGRLPAAVRLRAHRVQAVLAHGQRRGAAW